MHTRNLFKLIVAYSPLHWLDQQFLEGHVLSTVSKTWVIYLKVRFLGRKRLDVHKVDQCLRGLIFKTEVKLVKMKSCQF